jgi:hypothetical protein
MNAVCVCQTCYGTTYIVDVKKSGMMVKKSGIPGCHVTHDKTSFYVLK